MPLETLIMAMELLESNPKHSLRSLMLILLECEELIISINNECAVPSVRPLHAHHTLLLHSFGAPASQHSAICCMELPRFSKLQVILGAQLQTL